ncbi:MAG: cytochrome c, partial [Acidimicrobiia bacterium]
MENIIILVALGAIAWLAFIVATSVGGPGREGIPRNLSIYRTDEELESRRLERTMATAVVFSAFLALAIPLYYLSEEDRQAGFDEEFLAASIARGEIFFGSTDPTRAFRCDSCHGPEGVGGSAQFVEPRSGIAVLWTAPSLNDVFYRYTEDEIRFWITFGRANTPMPAWGLEGGGPLGEQSIQDLINYIRTFQISQEQALAKIEPAVTLELSKIDRGDEILAQALAEQELQKSVLEKSEDALTVVASVAQEAQDVLDHAGEGRDTDQDGLSDTSEVRLTELTNSLYVVEVEVDEDTGEETVTISGSLSQLLTPEEAEALEMSGIGVTLDPLNPETTAGTADLRAARTSVANLQALERNLRVGVENFQGLIVGMEAGITFLNASAAERLWQPDFEAIAEASFDGQIDDARRAVGLFKAYCARCHNSNWSAGLPYTLELASGGIGPALFEGRVNIQFQRPADELDAADPLVEFIKTGTSSAKRYGVNGMGTGRMPAFGAVLSQDDLEMIAAMLRGLGR